VAALPEVASDEEAEVRKDAFLRGMLPMVLAVNESLMEQRQTLLRLGACEEEGATLSPSARDWLAGMAERYGTEPTPRDLLERVDIVPPSLALAQSAIESGWGQSRFARGRNALFGERRAAAGATKSDPPVMRLVDFERPVDAVISYAYNLNTHAAYAEFRRLRAAFRTLDRPLDPVRLAGALGRYSERGGAYIRDVREMMASNHLDDFDTARLEEADDKRQVAER
jgi:Bax protein